MTVQVGPGALVMGANDFQMTTRGITWGVKFRDIGIGLAVFVVVKQVDGSWAQPQVAESYLESAFEEAIKTMDITTWIKTKLIPNLNLWLKKAFPATGTPAPTPVTPQEKFVSADAQFFGSVKITTNPDGTLTASVP